MRLADLRRLAIRQREKIHFRLRNGLECIVAEDGVARVPELKAVPDFNLEEELSAAGEFLVEPPPPGKPRTIQRQEMMKLSSVSPIAAATHDHEDE